MFNLSKIFPSSAPEKAPVAVIALRDMQITDSTGKQRHVSTGESFEIAADQLENYSREDLRHADPRTKKIFTDPTPPRPEPRPMPDRWENLPECFGTWWRIQEELRTAREHIDLIREKQIQFFGTSSALPSEGPVLSLQLRDPGPRENLYVGGGLIDMNDPEIAFNQRTLEAAVRNAEDYLKRLRESRSLELQRAMLECSTTRLAIVEKITPIVDELESIGFQLFKTRVAALGLNEYHERRLYHGSADFQRFGMFTRPSTSGMIFLDSGTDTGKPRFYLDDEVTSTATHLLNGQAQLAELEPILVAARKELAKTNRAAAATA